MSRWKQVKGVKKHRSMGRRGRYNKKTVFERRRLRKIYYKKMVDLTLKGLLKEKEIEKLKKSSEYIKFYNKKVKDKKINES